MEIDADQIRRALIQRLEDQRRAGVTHWHRPVILENTETLPVGLGKPTVTRPIETPAATSIPVVSSDSSRPAITPANNSLFGELENPEMGKKQTTEAVLPVCAPFQPLDLPLEERTSRLTALADRVRKCTRCAELAGTRTQTVFGVGNPQAKILFLGEAPGADEDAQGEPFVGRSGQLLNDIIKACRIRREDVYICNILRCRPPGNRLPNPNEVANCREFLEAQIALVNPEYIVCLGACAAQNLLGSKDPIGKLRSRFHQFGRAKVLCTYHPSYLLRNPPAKKDVWEDMKRLFLDMGIDLSVKPSK